MSETWKATREGWNNLKASLCNSSFEERVDLFWWSIGLIEMAIAIIGFFGGWGFLFVIGFITWKAMTR